MRTITLWLAFALASPANRAFAQPPRSPGVAAAGRGVRVDPGTPVHVAPLPRLSVLEGTLLLRETVHVGDGERTGNWRAVYRADGCYFLARNVTLWVTDPVLLASEDPTLHFNTPFPEEPGFCLTAEQRSRLADAADAARFSEVGPVEQGTAWIERWTAVVDGDMRTAVFPAGARPGALAPLYEALAELAREPVWGLSPEDGEGTGDCGWDEE